MGRLVIQVNYLSSSRRKQPRQATRCRENNGQRNQIKVTLKHPQDGEGFQRTLAVSRPARGLSTGSGGTPTLLVLCCVSKIPAGFFLFYPTRKKRL